MFGGQFLLTARHARLRASQPQTQLLAVRMYPAGNLFIPVAHGRLEAIVKDPPLGEPRGVALALHPHPLGGGTMHNKVVFQAARALSEAGLVVLRLNFRGVGQSTGKYDEGRGELEDVKAALSYLHEKYSDKSITLCGFSFGAWVGLEVGIVDHRVSNLISIGTPVNNYDFSFLEACRKAILFVHGERDEYGDIERLRQLVSILEQKTVVQLAVVKGAGHFFEGHLEELKRAITDWVTQS